jgi:transposase
MIVMGLDQHRGQITAEWIDASTGEVSRARVAPAHREPVRRFLGRFRGCELEVALEATTGWRFVVEELRAVGAGVHLAEPAETSARRGNKKRAKSGRADARHLRELLMIGRVPESWIAPDHLLDLRARVGLRHTLQDQRGERQQRIQAVLYHHGVPQRRQLMTRDGRGWLGEQALPVTAREQVAVAVAMIDALDVQIAPLDRELRAYARRQHGCRALMRHYGIGALTAVTILAELGDCRRFSSSRHAGPLQRAGHHRASVRFAPRARAPVASGAARVALGDVRGSSGRAPDRPARPRLLHAGRRAVGIEPGLPGNRAQAAQAQLPHAVRARRGGAATGLRTFMRAQPLITPMHRGRLPAASCRQQSVDGPERPSGRNALCGITPSTIMSPTRSRPGPWTEIRPGARAHAPSDSAATAPVKRFALGPPGRPSGDRAPPPTLAQQSPVAPATHNNDNPDATLAKASLHR